MAQLGVAKWGWLWPKPLFFFFTLAHRGSLATTILADLGVAEPPPWPLATSGAKVKKIIIKIKIKNNWFWPFGVGHGGGSATPKTGLWGWLSYPLGQNGGG
jgi:hypothetical protein